MRTRKIQKFRKALQLLPALVLAASTGLWSGCTQDSENELSPAGTGYDDEVIITVQIPSNQIPTTRSIADANGEAIVGEIDVLVYHSSSNTLEEHAQGKIISQSTSSDDKYEVQFRTKLTSTSEPVTIAVVANAAMEVSEAIGKIGGWGTPKEAFLSALTHIRSIPDPLTTDDMKWNATGTPDYDPIPMYGEIEAPKGIVVGAKIDNVSLIRMLARIDVVNSATNCFTLSRIYLVNYNTAGYIAPAWNENGTLQTALPSSPMIPPSPTNTPLSGTGNAIKYTYTHNNGTGMLGEIYTYEAQASPGVEGDAHTRTTCLILEGTYSGTTCFYRVDFTAATGTKVDYLPLYRNHRYTVTVTAAEGIGYPTIGAALQSLGVMNNLKTQLLVVDESQITNIVFNGQHYLGIGDDVTLGYTANNTAEVKCTTNYIGGWEIDKTAYTNGIEYATGRKDWLSATSTETGLLLETILDNPTTADREAYVHLKAGRLTHKLKVTHKFSPTPQTYLPPFLRCDNIKPYYPLNAGTYTFNVISNTDWKITKIVHEFTINPDNITTALNNRPAHNLTVGATGGNNTSLGDEVTFRAIYDYSGLRGTIYVTFESFDDSFTPVTQPLVVKGNIWARSNVVYDGTKLTFAVDRDDNVAIPANSQGVFFQWGSLVAISPAALSAENTPYYTEGMYPDGHIVYSPKELSNFSWTGLPYLSNKTTPPFDDNDTDADDFIDYNNGLGYDKMAANGDICRYISDQHWVSGSGRWRMPTHQDMSGLWDSSGYRLVYGDNWSSTIVTPYSDTSKHAYGYYQLSTGRIYGAASSTVDPTNPETGVSLPAVGYRSIKNTNTKLAAGEAAENSYRGYYWAGSSASNNTDAQYGNHFIVTNGSLITQFNSRQKAMSIRCIRED